MPKVAPGKVQFMACTIRSACTTKELPFRVAHRVCAWVKNHEKIKKWQKAMQEAQEAEHKCEFAKYEPYIWSLRIVIEPIQITLFAYDRIGSIAILKLNKIFYDNQLSILHNHLDIVILLIYLLFRFGISTLRGIKCEGLLPSSTSSKYYP